MTAEGIIVEHLVESYSVYTTTCYLDKNVKVEHCYCVAKLKGESKPRCFEVDGDEYEKLKERLTEENQ